MHLSYEYPAFNPTHLVAQAMNPPPDMTSTNDQRPQHWIEQSRNGDAWVMSRDGCSGLIDVAMGYGSVIMMGSAVVKANIYNICIYTYLHGTDSISI